MEIHQTALIEGLRNKDRAVFSIIYDRYSPALYGIILKIVKREEIAEDILQESFVKIWKNGPRYKTDRGSLFTWMMNICRNTAIDKTRSAHFQRLGRQKIIDQQISNHINWSQSPKTEHIGLKTVINELDDKYKEIIELVYFQGYTQQEVHEHLGIPLGTVKSRLRIGIRELRTFFRIHQVTITALLMFVL
jgi:RNA polymerase sigma-70 factor (ECF subfamily)